VPYSIEAESWTGLREEMTTEFADSKDVLEATQFTLGTGTPQPQGIIPFSTNLATTAGTATLAMSDIDNLTDALPERFQSNATILASRKIFSKVRQLGRTAGASDEWAPQQQGFPPSLNGYPKEILSTIVSTTTSNSLIAVVGDFRRFLIVDKIGMSVEYIPHLFDPSSPGYPTGTRGLFAYWRNNSLVQVVNAFRVLKVL
jgi:HK97 family phage major capsid protein